MSSRVVLAPQCQRWICGREWDYARDWRFDIPNGLYVLAGKSVRETRYVPCNYLSIHLPNGVLHGDHIAARGFRGMAGGVPVEFCLVYPKQEFNLFS
jgi:hypothetical protein